MNYELYEKILKCDFKELFEKKNYKYFDTGSYNLNIIGVRSTSYDRNVFDFSDKYDLTRDLSIAISEYAPESEVIVDNNKFT